MKLSKVPFSTTGLFILAWLNLTITKSISNSLHDDEQIVSGLRNTRDEDMQHFLSLANGLFMPKGKLLLVVVLFCLHSKAWRSFTLKGPKACIL